MLGFNWFLIVYFACYGLFVIVMIVFVLYCFYY